MNSSYRIVAKDFKFGSEWSKNILTIPVLELEGRQMGGRGGGGGGGAALILKMENPPCPFGLPKSSTLPFYKHQNI